MVSFVLLLLCFGYNYEHELSLRHSIDYNIELFVRIGLWWDRGTVFEVQPLNLIEKGDIFL